MSSTPKLGRTIAEANAAAAKAASERVGFVEDAGMKNGKMTAAMLAAKRGQPTISTASKRGSNSAPRPTKGKRTTGSAPKVTSSKATVSDSTTTTTGA